MCQVHKIRPNLEEGGILDINYSKAGFCIPAQVLCETCLTIETFREKN